MTLGELILELASIDNHRNIPHREMMEWKVEIYTSQGEFEIASLYCDEEKKRIYIDMEGT